MSGGYIACACRDCFELAIGEPGAFCHACEDAGCEDDCECEADGAYGASCCELCGDPEESGCGTCESCTEELTK